MADSIFAAGFKTDPYWWDAAPRPKEQAQEPIPAQADVVIVGSGYTGTSAALTLVRNGRKALVLEAEDPGYGASSRNAGYVGRMLWHKFGPLERKVGFERAKQLANDATESHRYLTDLIEKEQIACGYVNCSRFIAARTQGHFDHFADDLETFKRAGLRIEADIIPHSAQRKEIGTEKFYGGLLLHGTGALHPGLYHLGLLDRAIRSGAQVASRARVTNIERDKDGKFTVTTVRGKVRANDVLVATNAYTNRGPGLGWYQRRVVPVKLFQVATEPLAPQLLNRLLPGGRTLIDSLTNITWIRLSPDNTRIIIGGRTGVDEGGPQNKAKKLHADAVSIFPELQDVKLTHSWEGQCSFSFDKLPHVGIHNGVHYAMGYCGVGLPMGTWMGHRVGLKLLGKPEGATPFDGRGFPTRPLYTGHPWFMPAMMAYYDLKDRIDLMRG
jgi:glycine/D-amino acid oxidase-like deaminating enzyme